MKYSDSDISVACRTLSDLKPGQEILCHVEHVSRSGMARIIKFWTINPQTCTLEHLSWSIACVLEKPYRKDGVFVSGCGMDMGFHTVCSLSRALADVGILPVPEDGRDVIYTLKQRWI
jgi:hypothetical protein